MILSTYANLYALEESSNTKILMPTNKPHNQINNLPLNLGENNIDSIAYVHNDAQVLPNIKGTNNHYSFDIYVSIDSNNKI